MMEIRRSKEEWERRVKDVGLDNGWLSPEGDLYRCAYWEHVGLAYDLLGCSDDELFKAGWLKLQRKPSDGFKAQERHLFVLGDHCARPGRMTREQVAALVSAGFVPPNHLLELAEGDWSHLYAANDQREAEDMAEWERSYRPDPFVDSF